MSAVAHTSAAARGCLREPSLLLVTLSPSTFLSSSILSRELEVVRLQACNRYVVQRDGVARIMRDNCIMPNLLRTPHYCRVVGKQGMIELHYIVLSIEVGDRVIAKLCIERECVVAA